jgi:hypothetical protein
MIVYKVDGHGSTASDIPVLEFINSLAVEDKDQAASRFVICFVATKRTNRVRCEGKN